MLKRSLLLICVLLLAACGEPKLPSPYHATDISWRYTQPDFRLTDHNGKPRTLQDFSGKVVLLFFGYTHCPEVCPTTLVDMAQVMRKLGKDSERVQVLFVTLDPEQDSPELLAKFVPYFDKSFLALYGDAQATAQAAKAFGVSYEKHENPSGGYTLDHTDAVYLIGAKSRPLLQSPYHQPIDLLVQDVRMLLALER